MTRFPFLAFAALPLLACTGAPDSLAPSAVGFQAASNGSGSGSGSGEIWVAAQDVSQIKILHGLGSVETVPLPAGAGPHEINFSPSGDYAYIANVGNGDLIIMRSSDRQIVTTLDLGVPGFGDVGTHQAKPSPDGTVLLVAQIPSKQLIKVAADEASETWTVVGRLTLPGSPVCTAFRADGQRAYVSLQPSGLAIVDVPSLTMIGALATAGAVQCGLVESKDDETIYVDSNGGGGHFYFLDTSNDQLTDGGYPIGAVDLHGFGVSPNEKWAYAAARGSDALKYIDLTAPGSTAETLSLDATPAPDRPDKVAVKGDNVYVTLRASGKLALVQANQKRVTYLDLVPPSPNAIHGVVVRP